MVLNGIEKVVYRSLLRHANGLTRRKGILWLQKFPSVEEFQSSNYTTAKEDLIDFISMFPEQTQPYLLNTIPSRIVNGKDVQRVVSKAFRASPLKDSKEATGDLLECLRIVNNQVRPHK
jgi:hypothetical protein